MRASVCASTALVGSTRTSTSASAISARASTRRWRCPPEKPRPRSSTCASSPSGSASSTSSAFATPTAARTRSSSAPRHGSSSRRREPEKSIGSVSLTTIRRRTTSTGRSTRRTPPSVTPGSSTRRPRRSASAAASSGTGDTTAVTSARLHDEPARGVGEQRARRRLGRRLVRLAHRPLDREDGEHPPRADERARDLVHGLGRRPQRDDEERRVAVEGHEVARVDLAGQREVGAEPRDDDDEDPGEEHLRRVERRLRLRHAHAGLPDLLRAVAVAAEEHALAADAAQHAQPGHRVGAERGQLPDLLALLALPALERLDDDAEAGGEHRHAEQHDQAEHRRSGEQHGRDHDVRGDRPREPGGDVEGAAHPQAVAADRGDHLARRHAARAPRGRCGPRGAPRPG